MLYGYNRLSKTSASNKRMPGDQFVASLGITQADTDAMILNTEEYALLRHISNQLREHSDAPWKDCPLALTIVFNEVARNTVCPFDVKPKSFLAIESVYKKWVEGHQVADTKIKDWALLQFIEPTKAPRVGKWNDTEIYITSQIHSLLHNLGKDISCHIISKCSLR